MGKKFASVSFLQILAPELSDRVLKDFLDIESNSIVNQKAFLERYARQEKLPNIRHYIDDDESGRTLSECCNEWQDKYSLKGMESGA